jgi:hypothetical protein
MPAEKSLNETRAASRLMLELPLNKGSLPCDPGWTDICRVKFRTRPDEPEGVAEGLPGPGSIG